MWDRLRGWRKEMKEGEGRMGGVKVKKKGKRVSEGGRRIVMGGEKGGKGRREER